MVDVQHGALGALEEHPLAGLGRVEQIGRRIGHERPQPLGVAGVFLEDFLGVIEQRRLGARRISRAARQHPIFHFRRSARSARGKSARYMSPSRMANERPTLSR